MLLLKPSANAPVVNYNTLHSLEFKWINYLTSLWRYSEPWYLYFWSILISWQNITLGYKINSYGLNVQIKEYCHETFKILSILLYMKCS